MAIKAPLTFTDIRGILAGPATVHFGRVSAAAEAVSFFCINNTLDRPVHVLVDARCHDHLVRSQNMSQVCSSLKTVIASVHGWHTGHSTRSVWALFLLLHVP